MWTFWTQKGDFFNFTPLNPPTNTPFFGPLCDKKWTFLKIWGGAPHPLGYEPSACVQSVTSKKILFMWGNDFSLKKKEVEMFRQYHNL